MNRPTFTQHFPNETYNFAFKKSDKRPIRILILIGLLFMIAFLWVYWQPANRDYLPLFTLLTLSVTFKLLRLLHEWYHYWNVVPPAVPPVTRSWNVDVLTTFCPGEPYDMVVHTLQAIQAIRYPHTTYLCDEANDPYLRDVCEQMGVRHVTRTEKTDAKAGNINHALQQAMGDICLIIDPDHVPVPGFLDQVLPYFEDPDVGFVQGVQGYYNRKESLVAYGAAEQTYTFYGPMMTCMGNYGTAQAIGANCTFRRAALDSIGGHAAGLSEDMHTAMQLHANGWTSAYLPLPLSYGLVPDTLSAYYKQQLKWSRGTFELLVTTYPRVFNRLSWRQRLHYLTMPMHYLLGITQLFDLLIPIISLIMMRLPLRLDLLVFATAYIPLVFTAFLIRQYAQRWLIEQHEAGFHVLGGVLSSGTWWVYVLGLVYTIFRIDVPYLPTPKNDRPRNNFLLCLPNLIAILLTLVAIGFSIYHYGRFAVSNIYSQLMIGFCLLNVLIISLNVLIGQELLLAKVKNWIERQSQQKPIVRPMRLAIWHLRFELYWWLRRSAVPLFVGVLLLTTGLVAYTNSRHTTELPRHIRYATTQPFYYGLEPSGQQRLPLPDLTIVPQHLIWPITSQRGLKKATITRPHWSSSPTELPLLYIEPGFATRTTRSADTDVTDFLSELLKEKYDAPLADFVAEAKRYQKPVFLCFAPEFDDPERPWGTNQERNLALYQQAWQYIVRFCEHRHATNLIWVWCPVQPSTIVAHYPGAAYVDWIGLSIMNNPAKAEDGQTHSFAALYQQLHSTIRMHVAYSIRQKPILLTHIGATMPSRTESRWIRDAMDIIHERYPEIRGVVFSREQSQLAGLAH